MSSILILYASHFGQTRKISEGLAQRLRETGCSVELVDAKTAKLPAPDTYDLVAIGSRVEAGRHASSIVAYMHQHADALRARPTAFFSVSMAAAHRDAAVDPSGYLEATFEDLGWRPNISVALAGALRYREYGWLMRFIMKRIAKSAGHPTDTSRDHELTDWGKVDAFAEDMAALLPGERAVEARL